MKLTVLYCIISLVVDNNSMNNLKKQILSVAVATSTVLSCVPVSMAAIPADVQGTRYEEPVQILSALNIMVGDENGAYRLDDTIIRS